MGLVVADAGPVIALLDSRDAHHLAAQQAFATAAGRGDYFVLPASAYAESLVEPVRQGAEAIERHRWALGRLPLTIVPLDETVAEYTARLRAHHGARLRLPDALVVATALMVDADLLLTTDRGWPNREALGLRGEVVAL